MSNMLEKLEACEDVNMIDNILDSIGIVNDVTKRNEFLMSYMGVKQVCDSGEIGIETQYKITKEVLIEKDWKYMKGNA